MRLSFFFCLPILFGVTHAFAAPSTTTLSDPSAPPPSKEQCLAAADEGQQLRSQGDFVRARRAFARCISAECPATLRKECSTWSDSLVQATPSIVVSAVDSNGQEIVDLVVYIDETKARDRLDGRAMEVNPGLHKVRIERAGALAWEQSVFVTEGERLKRIEVRFAPTAAAAPPPPPPPPAPIGPPRPAKAVPWVGVGLGSLGLISAGVGAGLHLSAMSLRKQVDATGCAPNCDPSDGERIDAQQSAGNVTLVAGAALFAVGLTLVVIHYATGPAKTAGPVVSPFSRRF